MKRIESIDLMRGWVMVLMMVDHVSMVFSKSRFAIDTARQYDPTTVIPPAEFFLRWVTHLCAPSFLILAGFSLAVVASSKKLKLKDDFFLIKRGLLLIILDLVWTSYVFGGYSKFYFGVLYAIGGSMIVLAVVRRLPLVALSIVTAVLFLGFEALHSFASSSPSAITTLLITRGSIGEGAYCIYPLIPWFPFMLFGWIFGRFSQQHKILQSPHCLALFGFAFLSFFAALKLFSQYGFLGIPFTPENPLTFLAISKYPPSLAFSLLEIGLFFIFFGFFKYLEDIQATTALAPVKLFGQTALFFYLIHAVIAFSAASILKWKLEPGAVLGVTLVGLLLLILPCYFYLKLKRRFPKSALRYI